MNSTLTDDCLKVADLNQFGGPENEKPKLREKLLKEGLIKCNYEYFDDGTRELFKDTPYRLTHKGNEEDKFEYSNFFCIISIVIVFIILALYIVAYIVAYNNSNMLIVLCVFAGLSGLCIIGRIILHYRNPLRHFNNSGFNSIINRPRSDDPLKDFSSQ